jgi:hypothetical protein
VNSRAATSARRPPPGTFPGRKAKLCACASL